MKSWLTDLKSIPLEWVWQIISYYIMWYNPLHKPTNSGFYWAPKNSISTHFCRVRWHVNTFQNTYTHTHKYLVSISIRTILQFGCLVIPYLSYIAGISWHLHWYMQGGFVTTSTKLFQSSTQTQPSKGKEDKDENLSRSKVFKANMVEFNTCWIGLCFLISIT